MKKLLTDINGFIIGIIIILLIMGFLYSCNENISDETINYDSLRQAEHDSLYQSVEDSLSKEHDTIKVLPKEGRLQIEMILQKRF